MEIYRYERKFSIPYFDMKSIERELYFHPLLFKEIFKKRYINNVYFDTHNYSYAVETEDGISYRKKFRIRWYDDFFSENITPVLEIKIKNNHLLKKLSFPLKKIALEKGFNKALFVDLVHKSDVPDAIKEEMKRLTPSLFNRYYRGYYLSASKKFRITLDHDVRSWNVLINNKGYFGNNEVLDKLILELKYAREFDKEVFGVTKNFNFSLYKNSKYCSGIIKSR